MRFNWSSNALAEGMRCFSQQEFFAAHEHWETVWLTCEEPHKSFLQALIQVASAFHHHQRNNFPGTASLLKRALRKLEAVPACFEQVDVTELRLAIRDWLRALESPAPGRAFPSYPTIKIADLSNETQKPD